MGWGQLRKIAKLNPIKEKSSFFKTVKRDTLQTMVELKSLIQSMQYELRYASNHNFTGKRLYPRNTHTTYLRLKPALALAKVANELKEKKLILRPSSKQYHYHSIIVNGYIIID